MYYQYSELMPGDYKDDELIVGKRFLKTLDCEWLIFSVLPRGALTLSKFRVCVKDSQGEIYAQFSCHCVQKLKSF